MRILIGVEDIRDTEFAHCDHHPVGAARTAELIGGRLYRLRRIVKVQGLAQEHTRQAQIGLVLADLIGLAAGETRGAQSVVQSEALIDFAVDPALGAGP